MAFTLTPGGPDSGQDSRAGKHFNLEGNLDFETAAQALSAITGKLAQSDHLVLDLAGIESANSAGLAVLVECRAMASHETKSVTFLNMPDSLRKIAEVCQVQDLLA